MQPFTGFGPDLPPTTPGVLLEVSNMIPTLRGYKAAPSGMSVGYAALGEAANSLAVLTDLSGTRRVFAGTASAIYEATGGSWTDVSDAGGYTVGHGQWVFAAFGSTALAATKAETLQASTGTDFAAVSSAPKASWMDVSGGFVMLADTNDTTYGDQADRWWCSAYLDYADWTPAVSTQCATGRLIDAPGPILALKALGSGFVAYKRGAIFVASYVGAPAVWQWTQLPGEIGCAASRGVVSLGSAHAFIGHDDIYLFDGARPVPIGAPVKSWFFADIDPAYSYKIVGTYNQNTGNVWWFYPSRTSGGALDKALVFNVTAGRFGVVTVSVEAAVLYYAPGLTFDGLGGDYATYEDLPTDLSYDSPTWTAGAPDLAYIDTAHVLRTMTGTGRDSSLLTGNIGDDDQFTTVTRVRPRFLTAPATAELEHLYDDNDGDGFAPIGSPTTLYEGKFDALWSSRWHRFRLNFTGDVEIAGIAPVLAPDGDA